MRSSPLIIWFFATALGARGPSAFPLKIQMPADSPVLIQSVEITAADATIYFRNVGTKRISGFTLRLAPAHSLGPPASSVSLPALSVAPGSVFPVHFEFGLSFPSELTIDSVLFADSSSFGPDRLGTLHSMLVAAAERHRDQDYFAQLVRARKLPAIREELNFGLPENESDFQVSMRPESHAHIAGETIAVESISFPNAPVQMGQATIRISTDVVRHLRVSLRNTTARPISEVDLGLLVKDERGTETPVSLIGSRLKLAGNKSVIAEQPFTAVFTELRGTPKLIHSVAVYLAAVEFSDGSFWVPGRKEIDEFATRPALRRALADSPEQRLLASIFRKSGMEGVEHELKTMDTN